MCGRPLLVKSVLTDDAKAEWTELTKRPPGTHETVQKVGGASG
jgi:hypothetical protein